MIAPKCNPAAPKSFARPYSTWKRPGSTFLGKGARSLGLVLPEKEHLGRVSSAGSMESRDVKGVAGGWPSFAGGTGKMERA